MESGSNGGRDRLLARYRTERKIGEGAFGAVFRARDLQTGELVAVKRVRLRDTRNLPVNALRELSVLRRLEHPNVLALLDVRTDGASLALVTPFLPASLAANSIISPQSGNLVAMNRPTANSPGLSAAAL